MLKHDIRVYSMDILNKRASGVLLHITSLPSGFCIGDLGSAAFDFVDFLKKAGQQYWQILPLNPTGASKNFSPYACYSAFAGNPLLISPVLLYEQGLIKKPQLDEIRAASVAAAAAFDAAAAVDAIDAASAVVTAAASSAAAVATAAGASPAAGQYDNTGEIIADFDLRRGHAGCKGDGYNATDYRQTGHTALNDKRSDYISVDYKRASIAKNKMFNYAYKNFRENCKSFKDEFDNFCAENDAGWLEDFACFVAFKKYFKNRLNMASWSMWPQPVRDRNALDVKELKKIVSKEVELQKFLQFIFFKQWNSLKRHAGANGIKIFGDIPIYVDYESSDVWSSPSIFKLDNKKIPRFIAGVPPDYYSKTGQLWKNPVYDWEGLKKTGFSWWIARMEFNFKMFDLVRLDHFRGFIAYWEVPSGEKTAINGRWVNAYPEEFFNLLSKRTSRLPIVAENLGIITPDVDSIMERLGLPGLRVFQFGFGRDFPHSSHLPHNYIKNAVACTGTHDNNTLRGWLENEVRSFEAKNLLGYLRKEALWRQGHPVTLIKETLPGQGYPVTLIKAALPEQGHPVTTSFGYSASKNNPAGLTGEFVGAVTEYRVNKGVVNNGKVREGLINEIIILLMASAANLVIIPMQDILGLGQEARMNRPSTSRGNWKWQMDGEMMSDCTAERLAAITLSSKRRADIS